MKIRNGFVSNSSTTSFCIVGVNINDWKMEKRHKSIKELRELILPDGKDLWDIYEDNWGGETQLGDDLIAYGSDGDIYYIGVHAIDKWKEGISFKEVAEICRRRIKEKYGISVPREEFDIIYGESGSG